MKTFDEIYTGISQLRRLIDQAEQHGLLNPATVMPHMETLQEIQAALREYASLHLEMAPRILARGYIEAKS